MMIPPRSLAMLILIAAFNFAACQSIEARTFAVLEASDEPTMAELKSVLARAMNLANVELGPGDPTQTSTISVLPPRPSPHDGRSPALPTRFDIMMRGSKCLVVRHDTGDEYELAGLSCRPLTD